MGLDNYWKCDEHPTFEPELRLCGGLCSGHGCESFRGKVYSSIIEGLTNYSLYAEKLTNEEVTEIAEILENTSFKEAKEHDDWEIEEKEYNDLVRMFRAYANIGATLTSWW